MVESTSGIELSKLASAELSECLTEVSVVCSNSQNAVNMAKNLLKDDLFSCDSFSADESDDCIMEDILRSIINSQNMQIGTMIAWLEDNGYPLTEECVVEIESKVVNDGGDDNSSAEVDDEGVTVDMEEDPEASQVQQAQSLAYIRALSPVLLAGAALVCIILV